MNKTLRLIIPQWKGGAQSYYNFGADILADIAPPGENEITKRINIGLSTNQYLNNENGIVEESSQLTELKEIEKICNLENPDKIIVFGGDCSVSQAPFDYLSERYGDNLGVVWLDSHPDISTPANSTHLHEMVLSNLMGIGNNNFSDQMKNPIPQNRIIYAGLVEKPQEKFNSFSEKVFIPVISPEEVKDIKILEWIKDNQIKKLCIHFDLDVLSPDDFRSLTPSKPYQTIEEYGAAIGELKLNEIVEFLNFINNQAEIVGLSITEFVPWDLINMKNAMENLPIFN